MRALIPAVLMLAAAGCDAVTKAPQQEVDYRPEEAGTVDHALCLLGFTAVPLRRTTATGHHLVEARLNGREALFILDTGANLSVVDEPHARAFGLTERGARPGAGVAIGGSVSARQVSIESLELGGVAVRQRRIVVARLGNLTAAMGPLAGGDVHGLIGQDVLNEHRAVIDMDRPLLYLIEEDRDPAPVPSDRCRSQQEGEGAESNKASHPGESRDP